MSPQIDNKKAFRETLARLVRNGWTDVECAFRECVDAGVFGPDFRNQAFEMAAKEAIRKELRGGRIRDVDGNIIRVANIVVKDDTGEPRKVYKDETLFDVGDCVQVVRYWKGCKDVCEKRIQYYINLAISLHGPQIQGLLPLADD